MDGSGLKVTEFKGLRGADPLMLYWWTPSATFPGFRIFAGIYARAKRRIWNL